MRLPPIPRQIYEAVARRPRSTSELIALVWWLHPQDAPHKSTIKAHVWRINRAIRDRGERIIGEWGGDHTTRSDSVYRLVTSCRSSSRSARKSLAIGTGIGAPAA